MGYEDDGLAFAVPDPQQLRLQQVAGLNVECAVGFVHQQRVGLDRQGPRDSHALLHAAAELVWVGMFEARQADQVDVVARPLPPFGFGHACHFKAELDVAESGAPREKLEGLEDHAAAATGGTGDVVAVQEDGATIAVVDAVDDAQESRLAASGGAEQRSEEDTSELQSLMRISYADF